MTVHDKVCYGAIIVLSMVLAAGMAALNQHAWGVLFLVYGLIAVEVCARYSK